MLHMTDPTLDSKLRQFTLVPSNDVAMIRRLASAATDVPDAENILNCTQAVAAFMSQSLKFVSDLAMLKVTLKEAFRNAVLRKLVTLQSASYMELLQHIVDFVALPTVQEKAVA